MTPPQGSRDTDTDAGVGVVQFVKSHKQQAERSNATVEPD
jgi:hypothetical protein